MMTQRHDTPSTDPRPTALITGFSPFGGDALNPSWLAAQRLDCRRIAGHTVRAAQLPTEFGASLRALDAALQAHRPALVICLGLAAGRPEISVERVAINVDDARIPDNAGQAPVDVPVVRGGPAAYFTRLPIKAIVQALREAGLPAGVSQTAGTYVCNHVFYGLLHRLARRRSLRGMPGGFIHVPQLPEQAAPDQPSLALDDLVRGLSIALDTAITHRQTHTHDLAASGGAEH